MCGSTRRIAIWLAASGVALSWYLPAAADSSASLPTFAACIPATPPELPARWRAISVMMPFLQGQLDVGEFVYDAALPAMRATVYGLKTGAVDLLITDRDTYVLAGPHGSPSQCTSLGARLRVPAAQWLTGDSACVGESPLGDRAVQWWNTSGFDQARYWVAKDTRLPWRSLFLRRALNPAIIGDYAMSYFSAFTPLPETNLSTLRDFCAASAQHYSGELPDVPTARDLMAVPNPDADAEAERAERIASLVPGLSQRRARRWRRSAGRSSTSRLRW
jgi:hypothetical protein